MVLAELVHSLAMLDPSIAIGLVINNLHWAFIFLFTGYCFTGGKKALQVGLIAWFIAMATMEIFNRAIGFSVYTATGLMLLYLGRLFVLRTLIAFKRERDVPLVYVLLFYATVGAAFFLGV